MACTHLLSRGGRRLAVVVFSVTDRKTRCLIGKKCREDPILCDLSDLRGELLQVLFADQGHLALTTGQCAFRITWRALDPKMILPTADVFLTPTTISSMPCS